MRQHTEFARTVLWHTSREYLGGVVNATSFAIRYEPRARRPGPLAEERVRLRKHFAFWSVDHAVPPGNAGTEFGRVLDVCDQ